MPPVSLPICHRDWAAHVRRGCRTGARTTLERHGGSETEAPLYLSNASRHKYLTPCVLSSVVAPLLRLQTLKLGTITEEKREETSDGCLFRLLDIGCHNNRRCLSARTVNCLMDGADSVVKNTLPFIKLMKHEQQSGAGGGR